MATRICVYKDCNNFYYRQDNSGSNVTLFSFPKDPKRAEQWHKLGKVHPKIGPKQLYMCSKHFDDKYLSTNKNRRILLGEAMPFSYKETKNKAIVVDNDGQHKQMAPTSSTEPQMFYINAADDDNTNCSSTQQSFYINLDDDDLRIDKVVKVESTTTAQAQEPNILDNIQVSIMPSPSKRARISSPETIDEELPPAVDDDQFIDSNEVSIFKFKGEQYVQMSKEFYLQEKRQLLNQLNSYKSALTNIKMTLKSLKEL